MNLTAKLTSLFMLLSMIPMAIVGYLAYDNGQQTIEQNFFNHLTSTALYKNDEFERWNAGNEHILRLWASRPLVRNDAAVLVAHTPADPAYEAAAQRLLETHFRSGLEDSGYLALFLLNAADGMIHVSTDADLVGKYRESESFFIEGQSRTYVQNINYSVTHGTQVMHVSTPVRDENGNVMAVLAAHADLAEISEIMAQSSGLSETEETYLVNAFNFRVAGSRFESSSQQRAIYTAGVTDCLAGNNGTGYYEDYRGVPVMGAYRWLPERELCLLTEVDQAEAFAPIVALRNTVLKIAAIVALSMTLLGALFARTITVPVRRLVKGTEEIGRGNLGYRITGVSRDEIGQLAEAFNQMAANLSAITASRDELNREMAERKQAEEAVRQLNETLEQRILQRTAELEAANKELEAFTYSVSHDLRAPLRAIDGFSRILVEDYAPQLSDEIQRYLGLTRQNAQQMGQLIDHLLTFSRLNRQPLTKQTVDLAALARQVLDDLRDEPAGREAQITIDDLPTCQADPILLKQVFANLLGNALKFTRGREIAAIEVGCREENGESVYFVRDNGVGFDMQYADKLFGVFQRLHRSEDYEGTGVGLATVQRIIHRHGGRVWAEAQVNQGATIYFTLGREVSND